MPSLFRRILNMCQPQSIQALLLARHRVNRQASPLRLLLAELRSLSPAAVQANPQLSRRVMVRHQILRLSLVPRRHFPHQGFPALRRPAAPATLLRTFRRRLPALPRQSIQALLLARHRVNRQVSPLRLLLAEIPALSPAAVQANPQVLVALQLMIIAARIWIVKRVSCRGQFVSLDRVFVTLPTARLRSLQGTEMIEWISVNLTASVILLAILNGCALVVDRLEWQEHVRTRMKHALVVLMTQ